MEGHWQDHQDLPLTRSFEPGWWSGHPHRAARRARPVDRVWPVPVEVQDAVPFPEDVTHDAHDAEAVTALWRMLVEMERV